MKASSKTTTKVRVHISEREIAELVRAAGIHVPMGVELDCYTAPFDTEFDADGGGIMVEWTVPHATEQG